MRQIILAAATAGAVLCALPASAQTPAPPPPPAASGTGVYLGVTGGVGAVQKVGGVLGGELGFRITDMIEVFGEGVWLQNVATRRRLDLAASLATYLQTSQGGAATGTLEIPAVYGGGGARFLFGAPGHIRPYVTIGGGMARVTLKPAITLKGADVTSSLSTYGVTLGSDLTGELTKPAVSGGIGARIAQGNWHVDVGAGAMSILTEGQATNVLRAGATFGFNF